jgi:hypothetical protein
MLQLERITKDSRTLKALLGMGRGEFDNLLLTFTRVLVRHALRRPRQRAIGDGYQGVLDTPGKKLFFVLFYLKVYPTFDVSERSLPSLGDQQAPAQARRPGQQPLHQLPTNRGGARLRRHEALWGDAPNAALQTRWI